MFKLESPYAPTGDQPQAIAALVDGIRSGARAETLLGVTGSGKTFTIANVIAELNRPTLILSHNKTLAAQLYSEMRAFFPHNAVEYFVSYYDYYQPEAYIPSTDTYIEKDLSINEEIDRLRLSATAALLSGRKDVIVVSSVSCLYGIGRLLLIVCTFQLAGITSSPPAVACIASAAGSPSSTSNAPGRFTSAAKKYDRLPCGSRSTASTRRPRCAAACANAAAVVLFAVPPF